MSARLFAVNVFEDSSSAGVWEIFLGRPWKRRGEDSAAAAAAADDDVKIHSEQSPKAPGKGGFAAASSPPEIEIRSDSALQGERGRMEKAGKEATKLSPLL